MRRNKGRPRASRRSLRFAKRVTKRAKPPALSQLVAKFNPVFGAVIYNYRLLANTPGAVPVIEQDTATTHTFSSLVAGVKYTIDVNAAGTAGTSDWSGAISLTAD